MAYILRSNQARKGSDAASLRKWAILFMAVGLVGRAILLGGILDMNSMNGAELMSALDNSGAMTVAGAAIFCGIIETCAVPLFAFLLVEGFLRTSRFEKYLLRVACLAVVSELPYNLAISGRLLDLSSRNPAFGLVICLVMLFFWNRYGEKSVKNILMKVLTFLAAFLWCLMLHIDQGICIVVFVAVLWAVRAKSNFRSLTAFAGAMICTLFDFFYVGACLSCIMLHRYSEERGEQNRIVSYAAYPVLLLVLGIAAKFL